MTRNEAIFRILDRYKFTEHVDGDVRAYLPNSRTRVLKCCLKKTGDYSLMFGIVIFVLFTAKRFGFKMSLATSKAVALVLTAVTAAAVSGGIAASAYVYVVNSKPVAIITEPETPVTESEKTAEPAVTEPAQTETAQPEQNDTPPQISRERMEIVLYTGKIYHGLIISRGQTLVVRTSQGDVRIPANKVRMIRKAQ